MPPDPDLGADFGFVDDLPLTRDAIAFAQERHRYQRRAADGAPFLLHPLEVSSTLKRCDCPDYVVAAAVLHDVLEDTDAERSDLSARFGSHIAELVALVSDDPTIGDEELRKDDVRERVRRAGGYALAVYAADKVSKVRELRMLIATGLDQDAATVQAAALPKIARHARASNPQQSGGRAAAVRGRGSRGATARTKRARRRSPTLTDSYRPLAAHQLHASERRRLGDPAIASEEEKEVQAQVPDPRKAEIGPLAGPATDFEDGRPTRR